MTENDFRVKYCELMEYYQYVEMRLRFICASLLADEEKGWFARLDDFESDPFGALLQKTMEYQKKKNITILSHDDFATLDEMRIERNYWAHQCFSGHPHVTFKKGELRNQMYANRVISDLNEAMEWDEKLTEKLNAAEI